ncbi:hypothetical protein DFH28DRAFT_1123790 [Melampsora americana]|nr:hypothetical protein DFH28DRAFT_1123790 [Melampsora americana]
MTLESSSIKTKSSPIPDHLNNLLSIPFWPLGGPAFVRLCRAIPDAKPSFIYQLDQIEQFNKTFHSSSPEPSNDLQSRLTFEPAQRVRRKPSIPCFSSPSPLSPPDLNESFGRASSTETSKSRSIFTDRFSLSHPAQSSPLSSIHEPGLEHIQHANLDGAPILDHECNRLTKHIAQSSPCTSQPALNSLNHPYTPIEHPEMELDSNFLTVMRGRHWNSKKKRAPLLDVVSHLTNKKPRIHINSTSSDSKRFPTMRDKNIKDNDPDPSSLLCAKIGQNVPSHKKYDEAENWPQSHTNHHLSSKVRTYNTSVSDSSVSNIDPHTDQTLELSKIEMERNPLTHSKPSKVDHQSQIDEVEGDSKRRPYLKLDETFPLDPYILRIIEANTTTFERWILEAFCRVGLWLEAKGIWEHGNWGTLLSNQLARFIDLGGHDRLSTLLSAHRPLKFEEILKLPQKFNRTISLITKDHLMHIRLNKDYTPRGLFYRTLIKAMRKYTYEKRTTIVNRNELENEFVMPEFLPPQTRFRKYTRWAEAEGVIEVISRKNSPEKDLKLTPNWIHAVYKDQPVPNSKVETWVVEEIESLMRGDRNVKVLKSI